MMRVFRGSIDLIGSESLLVHQLVEAYIRVKIFEDRFEVEGLKSHFCGNNYPSNASKKLHFRGTPCSLLDHKKFFSRLLFVCY